jgi:hypothetical protein
MGFVILVVIIVVIVIAAIVSLQKQKADLAVMPPGSTVIGRGFYRTPSGEIWHDRQQVSNVHAEVDATQRHTLTRVVTVVGAATKKTDGTLVMSYTTQAGPQVKTITVKGAGQYRAAMTFAAKLNALGGSTQQTA